MSGALEELGFLKACVQYWLHGGRVHSRRKVLVNGSPKTGTTWLLSLVSSIPGYRLVGNFRGDLSRYRMLNAGQVVHDHAPYSDELFHVLREQDVRVILTLRDPRDQTVSRIFHIRRDTTHAWHSTFRRLTHGKSLMACIEGRQPDGELPGLPSAADLIRLTEGWSQSEAELLAVKYEELVARPLEEVLKMTRFLGVPVDEPMAARIAARNRFERLAKGRKLWRRDRKPGQEDPTSHFRKGIVGDWRNHFQPDHIRRFKELAGDALMRWGYEPNLSW